MLRTCLLLLLLGSNALAVTWETMPGASRAINNGLSASRDAAHPSWQYLPRETRMGGADFGVFSIRSRSTTLRCGFMGAIELESDNDDAEAHPADEHSINTWRGLFGLSAMFSFDRAAERALGKGGAIELGISVRHESDHGYDDYYQYYFESGPPHIGDFVMPEAAVRIPIGRASLDIRIQDKYFLQYELDGYTYGPGAELIASWRIHRRAYPFMSNYWEYLYGEVEPWNGGIKRKTPDNQYYRNMVGVVLPGKYADLAIYSAMMAGNQKGRQVFKEQFTWGWGIRVVLFGSE